MASITEFKSDLLAPGARVVIRDEEWIVRRIDRVGEGKAIHVMGVSELTRNREAIFLEQLEKDIKVLAPEETLLVADASPQYRQSRLYIESMLRRVIPPMQEKPELFVGHKAAMDVLPYQLTPAIQALEQPRQRILIADAVGLGKTLECGILLSELIRRGRGKRILVLAIKSLLTQFQKEMWSRFSIPLTRLDSAGIQRIRRQIPTNHNPFEYHDKVIISIDTLKQDAEYRNYLERAYWDIIVIDEAHNVADRSGVKTFYGKASSHSRRTRLARLLSQRSDTLIMLSATPHDGKAQSFASLMNMLNPTAIADPHKYVKEDIKGLFVRRFKKDILDQVGSSFQERSIHRKHITATSAEESAFEALVQLKFRKLDQQGASQSGRMLFSTTLEKALFSSPAACLKTIENRIQTLDRRDDDDFGPDIEALQALAEKVKAIEPEQFSRFQALVKLITQTMKWKKTSKDDRLVIFTERIETLRFLQKQLPEALKLKDKEVDVLYGSLSDIEQQRVVEAFGKEQSPIRLLIASDVAAEGINLHYLCHRMIHFDIPWSLMTFQQRNGRIDRYGQTHKPEIYYLMTDSQVEKIRGDQRILDLLIIKDEQAMANIGDPSALMGKYNEDDEAMLTAKAIEQGLSPDAFEAKSLNALTEEDQLEALLAGWQTDILPTAEAAARTRSLPSLFASPLDYLTAGLQQLEIQDFSVHDDQRGFFFEKLPEDLVLRFKAFPKEIWDKDAGLNFSMDTEKIQQEIALCRKEESAWPRLHYLWEQHPVMEWLNDKVMASFGRHQAPVIQLNSLAQGEVIFLISGLFPNRKGHPLIWEWMGVQFLDKLYKTVLRFDAFLERSRFDKQAFPNPGQGCDVQALQVLLQEAVPKARNWMTTQKLDFEAMFASRLSQELTGLSGLKNKQMQQLEIDFPDVVGKMLDRKQQRDREIEKTFSNYQSWVKDTMTLAERPYLQVIATFVGGE